MTEASAGRRWGYLIIALIRSQHGRLDYEFLAMRTLAAFRRLAMRLRAYLIGSSSTASGSYSSAHSFASVWRSCWGSNSASSHS
jgi:hypothetical protein